MRPLSLLGRRTLEMNEWRRITAIGIEPSSLKGRYIVYLKGKVENIIGARFQGPNDGKSGSEETYFMTDESELVPLYPTIPHSIG